MYPSQLTNLSKDIHEVNKEAGWWDDGYDFFNLGVKILLIHSEVSEMAEGLRKGLRDTHLPHRSNEEVEAADALIRLLDYCGARGFDIGSAVAEKMDYNKERQDHKRESRSSEGGKKF